MWNDIHFIHYSTDVTSHKTTTFYLVMNANVLSSFSKQVSFFVITALPSCRRCSWVATVFHSEPNMRRDADTQHLWRQSVSSCRPRTMEQSSVTPERRWLIVYSEFRRSLKTFLFGQWGHGAVWTVLTAPSRNSCTYLLTYLQNARTSDT